MQLRIFLLGLFVFGTTSFAQTRGGIDQPRQLSSFYRIAEPQQTGLKLVSIRDLGQTASDLLNWALDQEPWPDPQEPYNRLKQFGGWLKDKTDCQDTRAKVLERASEIPVQMNPSGCSVDSGEWYDPYTGETFTQAHDLQIDHLVPLENAYVSGASTWDHKTRCAYANFLANPSHLLAVDSHSNMAKGDRTPAEWVPSNQGFVCTYIKDWLTVKLVWHLILSSDEAQGIRQEIQTAQCDPNAFQISESDLASLRQAIVNSEADCN